MKPLSYSLSDIEEYRRKGYWTEDNTADLWEKLAYIYPNKEALVDSRHRFTWAQCDLLTKRLALGFLGLGLKKDEPVIAQLPNVAESVLLRRACQTAGLLFSPPGIQLRHHEMGHILRATKARVVVIPLLYNNFNYYQMIMDIKPNLPHLQYICIIGEEVPAGAVSIEEMMKTPREKKDRGDHFQKIRFSPYEVDFIPVTSGTTGMPKVSAWIMAGMLFQGRAQIERVKITTDSIILSVLNNHLGGALVYCWGATPYTGSKLVLLEKFDAAEALKLIEREKVTNVACVPTQLIMMLEHPNLNTYDLSSLRILHYSGASLSFGIAKKAEEQMKCKLVSEYGSMDYGNFSMSGIDMTQEERLLTSGRLGTGTVVKVLDDNGRELPRGEVGEMWVKGPLRASSGYYNDPESTLAMYDKEGFFCFGDLGKVDERDFVTVVGRKKDMIIRGGQNIYPVEIEKLLLAHPKISNVAIVPMYDPVFGEKACAFVICKPHVTHITLRELTSFLLEKKLAKYKLPERLEIRDFFPLLSEAKIDKRTLAAEIAHKGAVES